VRITAVEVVAPRVVVALIAPRLAIRRSRSFPGSRSLRARKPGTIRPRNRIRPSNVAFEDDITSTYGELAATAG
jgi:hypothetical protein